MRARGTAAAMLAAWVWAADAQAATWVRYDVSGAGTADWYGWSAPLGEVQSVSFKGTAYADLDVHAAGGWWSDGGTAFLGYATLSGVPASATAGQAGTTFSLDERGIGGGIQAWTITALLPGAGGRLPSEVGTQSIAGDAVFRLGNARSYYSGTGHVSALTVTRVAAPGAWNLSLTPGPVPEPGSWATLLLGFALLGAGLRYRRVSRRALFG